MSASMMLAYLHSGPLKLGLVAVFAWLGLFTLFISSGFFLRGHQFEHPAGIIPNGALEKRTFLVAALKTFPLSPANQQTLYSLDPSSYIDFSFDTTNPAAGPTINRLAPSRAYSYHLNATIARLPISVHPVAPWSTFGLRPADAVELNSLIYSSNRWKDYISVYAWPSQKTREQQVIRLSFSDKYAPGGEFATVTRTRTSDSSDSWLVTFAPGSHPGASTRALPVQRTLALFLWPVLFHSYLSEGGMAGVVLLWVCLMTAGYACITVMVAQWVVRTGKEGREERRGQGAALRWEEEGWAIMNAVGEEASVRRSEDEEDTPLLKDGA
ncbi:hypothetical protein FRC06_008056 [Ceratobasidium sp. 370]|nr:hypothetical protein FRC06_008056 [Ceratobasidium sp. 370]